MMGATLDDTETGTQRITRLSDGPSGPLNAAFRRLVRTDRDRLRQTLPKRIIKKLIERDDP